MPKNKSVSQKKTQESKKRPDVCDRSMTFHECELAVLRQAVDENEEMVEMLEASRQYQNNVEVVSTMRSLMMRTINMGK